MLQTVDRKSDEPNQAIRWSPALKAFLSRLWAADSVRPSSKQLSHRKALLLFKIFEHLFNY